MTSDSAMLNVNNTSSMNGGSGRIIIARMAMRPTRHADADAHHGAEAGIVVLWLAMDYWMVGGGGGCSKLGAVGGATPRSRAARSW